MPTRIAYFKNWDLMFLQIVSVVLLILEIVFSLGLPLTGWYFLCKLIKIKFFGIISFFVFIILGKIFALVSAAMFNQYAVHSNILGIVGDLFYLLTIVSVVNMGSSLLRFIIKKLKKNY